MIVRLMKENMPWVVPSVAIVLAATGFFDRGDSTQEPQTAQTAAPEQNMRPATTATSRDFASVNEVSRSGNIATSLNALSSTGGLNNPGTVPAQPLPVAAVAPDSGALQAPSEPSLSDDPAGFFAAAQAKLAAKSSCTEDLRNLTAEARVYFPSGGLTGEERGMGQARLIGLVAQNCPGVRIRVEGHSDPSGDPAINLRLSQQRAEAIIARIAAAGIDTGSFFAQGYGEAEPSAVRGPKPSAHYDRRVEFEVIEIGKNPAVSVSSDQQWSLAPCAAELQDAVQKTKVFYPLRSITSSASDMAAVLDLATKAAACPQARLRVVGQHSDQPGSGETAATGRLRAAAMMSALIGEGIEAGEIIIGAPSWSQAVPGRPGLSNSRVDFDVILEDS